MIDAKYYHYFIDFMLNIEWQEIRIRVTNFRVSKMLGETIILNPN